MAGEIYANAASRPTGAFRARRRATSTTRGLARGHVRLAERRLASVPALRAVRTLETVACTERGKQLARKADRLIDVGRLEEARVQLAGACQNEPNNAELAERLQILYEALALEPM